VTEAASAFRITKTWGIHKPKNGKKGVKTAKSAEEKFLVIGRISVGSWMEKSQLFTWTALTPESAKNKLLEE
jgi:hypothetical protein